MDLNSPGLAIIIDAWPGYPADTVKSIRDFCQTNRSIKVVALASYNWERISTKERICNTDEPWYSNTQRIFEATSHIPMLEIWWRNLVREEDRSRTHSEILQLPLRPDQTGFFLLNPLQLIYYCNMIDSSIENFWFFGGAWEKCLMTRPVGWYQLSAFYRNKFFTTKKNFLTRRDCVTGVKWKVPLEISDPWRPIDTNTYLLEHSHIKWDDRIGLKL